MIQRIIVPIALSVVLGMLPACRTEQTKPPAKAALQPAPDASGAHEDEAQPPDTQEARPELKEPTTPPPEGDTRSKPTSGETQAPEPPRFTMEDFAAFGEIVAKALNERAADAVCLTEDELYALYTPGIAQILQTGRHAWLNRMLRSIGEARVKFVEVKPGPEFTQTVTPEGPKVPFLIQVPYVEDLRLELTIGGDPRALTIEKMFFMGTRWKIFDANLAD